MKEKFIFKPGTGEFNISNKTTRDDIYKLISQPTNTSDLINDGEDSINKFITAIDLLGGKDRGIISGSGVTNVQNLDYQSSSYVYVIEGKTYTFPETSFTLSPSDNTLNRIDVVVGTFDGDGNGVLAIKEGVLDASPVKPSITEEVEIELTFITVNANDTTAPVEDPVLDVGDSSIYSTDGSIAQGVTRQVYLDSGSFLDFTFADDSDGISLYRESGGAEIGIFPLTAYMSHDNETSIYLTTNQAGLFFKSNDKTNFTNSYGLALQLGSGGTVNNPTIGQVLSASSTNGDLEWTTVSSSDNVYTADGAIPASTFRTIGVGTNSTFYIEITDTAPTVTQQFLFEEDTAYMQNANIQLTDDNGDSYIILENNQKASLGAKNGLTLKLGSNGTETPPTVGQVLAASSINGDLEWVTIGGGGSQPSFQDIHDGDFGTNNYTESAYISSPNSDNWFDLYVGDASSYIDFYGGPDSYMSFEVDYEVDIAVYEGSFGVFAQNGYGSENLKRYADLYMDTDEFIVRTANPNNSYRGGGFEVIGDTSVGGERVRLYSTRQTGIQNRLDIAFPPAGSTAIHRIIVPAPQVSSLTDRYLNLGISDGSSTVYADSDGVTDISSLSLGGGGDTSIYSSDGSIPTGVNRVVSVGTNGSFEIATDNFESDFWMFNDTMQIGAKSLALYSIDNKSQLTFIDGTPLEMHARNGFKLRLGSAGTPTPPTVGQVLSASSTTGDLEWSDIGVSSGLIATDEGNGIGYRAYGRDLSKFGNIGESALDLSNYYSKNTGNLGATGDMSLAFGNDNIASGQHSVVFGYNNINNGYASLVSGDSNTLSEITSNYNFSTGARNVMTSSYGGTIGEGLITRSAATTAVGQANNDYASSASQINVASAPHFIVGNGVMAAGAPNTVVSRSDAFIVFHNGEVTAPSLTTSKIDAADSKVLITKEYISSNIPFLGSENTFTKTQVISPSPQSIPLKLTTGIGGYTADLTTINYGEVSFGNGSFTTTIPTIFAKSEDSVGLFLLAGANDSNTFGDMAFHIREDDNSDFATLTNKGFRWVRSNTELMNLKRNGDLTISGNLNINDVLNVSPSSTPSSPSEGDVYFDSTAKKLRVYNGTAWIDLH